jgi:hypothetical protein
MFSPLPPFPVSPKVFCAFNVLVLAALVAAAEQNDKRVSMPAAVDSIAGAHIDTKLKHSLADGLPIPERSVLNLTNPPRDTCLRLFVAEAIKPFFEWTLALALLVDDQVEHGVSVA